jgi:hypothetical protein
MPLGELATPWGTPMGEFAVITVSLILTLLLGGVGWTPKVLLSWGERLLSRLGVPCLGYLLLLANQGMSSAHFCQLVMRGHVVHQGFCQDHQMLGSCLVV